MMIQIDAEKFLDAVNHGQEFGALHYVIGECQRQMADMERYINMREKEQKENETNQPS